MSGRKNGLLSKKIVAGGDASQSTVTSSVVPMEFLDNIGVQCNITSGSPSGSFAVQVSADYNQDANGNVLTTGNWISVNLPISATVTSGNPANIYIDLMQLSSPWLRVVYTKTSGTGNFDVFVTGKMI